MSLWRSKYFKPEELLSRDGLDMYFRGVFPLRQSAVEFLDSFRESIDAPIIVNSGKNTLRGFRSPVEHLSLVARGVTQNEFSFHCQGHAFDVSSPAFQPKDLAERALSFGWSSIIVYKTWVHLDLRDNGYYWGNRAD